MMESYEKRFASLFGTDYHGISFWKGRVGLYAILKALGISRGDEVILPGYTCVVVANSIRYTGATPVFADISPREFNLDPTSVEQRITNRTRALIFQHTYGIPANFEALQAIARRRGLDIIEDCAHVLPGSGFQNRLLGSIGRAGFFSSQWSKPYTTGLGGMVLTGDADLASRLRRIQTEFHEPPIRHRMQLQLQYWLYSRLFHPKLYWLAQKSLNSFARSGLFLASSSQQELNGSQPADIDWRMSAFQHKIGLAHIGTLGSNLLHRRRLSSYYFESLRRHGWRVPDFTRLSEAPLLRFPVLVANKSDILEKSRRRGVEVGSWFESPLHPLKLEDHQRVGYQLGSCPVAEATAQGVINLPLHSRVSDSEAERIVHFILSFGIEARGS